VREPQSAGNALERLLERLGLDRQLRTYRALMHWDEIVGAQLAQVARRYASTHTRCGSPSKATLGCRNSPSTSERFCSG
jgi:predicted nucleic acid-binding Zn ribbon protein